MLLTDLLPLRNKILLVRHGESEANVSGVISSDPALSTVQHGLTDVGRAQARAAAETVRELAASADASTIRIYASDFLRTRQTAHELAHALGASTDTVVEDVRLRERYFGDYNGGSADLYHTIWAHDASSAHHTHANCESVAAVRGRVVNLVAELGRTHIGGALNDASCVCVCFATLKCLHHILVLVAEHMARCPRFCFTRRHTANTANFFRQHAGTFAPLAAALEELRGARHERARQVRAHPCSTFPSTISFMK